MCNYNYHAVEIILMRHLGKGCTNQINPKVAIFQRKMAALRRIRSHDLQCCRLTLNPLSYRDSSACSMIWIHVLYYVICYVDLVYTQLQLYKINFTACVHTVETLITINSHLQYNGQQPWSRLKYCSTVEPLHNSHLRITAKIQCGWVVAIFVQVLVQPWLAAEIAFLPRQTYNILNVCAVHNIWVIII